MNAHRLNPILNVSDIEQSFAWFEKLGWKRGWDWGTPPTFGGVCSGACEIFLCQNGQGGRDTGVRRASFGAGADEAAEKGVWMSIWVDDVDALHRRCIEHGIDVTIRSFTREELQRADEVFLTGTAAEVTPVREIDGVTLKTGKGTLGAWFQRAYLRAVTGKDEKRSSWLTAVNG